MSQPVELANQRRLGQRRQHEGRLLADRQNAAGLRADGHTGARVGVQHAARSQRNCHSSALTAFASDFAGIASVVWVMTAASDRNQVKQVLL